MFVLKRIVAESEIIKAPIKFMWIPGIRPVIVPARIPINKKRRI